MMITDFLHLVSFCRYNGWSIHVHFCIFWSFRGAQGECNRFSTDKSAIFDIIKIGGLVPLLGMPNILFTWNMVCGVSLELVCHKVLIFLNAGSIGEDHHFRPSKGCFDFSIFEYAKLNYHIIKVVQTPSRTP